MSSPRYARVRDLPELATAPDPGDVLEIETVDGASRRVSVATLGSALGADLIPELDALGQTLLASDDGSLEAASIYPPLLRQLAVSIRAMALEVRHHV